MTTRLAPSSDTRSLIPTAGAGIRERYLDTRCALPQFCLRVSNNFGVLQKRFAKELGKDVVLLTITFDPQRDTPEALAAYAAQWKPAPRTWHFLTGPTEAVQELAVKGFIVGSADEPIFHSNYFVLVDPNGAVRAYFTCTDSADMPELVAAIKLLKSEFAL